MDPTAPQRWPTRNDDDNDDDDDDDDRDKGSDSNGDGDGDQLFVRMASLVVMSPYLQRTSPRIPSPAAAIAAVSFRRLLRRLLHGAVGGLLRRMR